MLWCDGRWLALAWTLVWSSWASGVPLSNSSSPLHCTAVRHALQNERGFGEIPREPVSAATLNVCGSSTEASTTCCTERMEAALAARARQTFDQRVQDSLTGELSTVLRARATRFDEFFRELLATSKHDFHEMFKKTYGVIYEQNSYVFTELFEQLERYYTKGRVRLEHAMESFFATLYQKMFVVLNGQYHFDDKYLMCVGDHMKELRPFGDVPHKLSVQVKRSFVATRTFAVALDVAANVAVTMQKVPPPHDCGRALARMSGCNVCQGRPNLKACSGFCSNVMRGCLAYHSDLDKEWNDFVDGFVKISDRLLGPFNIEVVVEPINIKISEAIMNFQESGSEVSNKVFSGCGRPRLGKRHTNKEIQFESLHFGRNSHGNRGAMLNGGSVLEKLINDTRHTVKNLKNFWSLLPLQLCNNDELAASPQQESHCWNGQNKAKYTQQLVSGTGSVAHANNPEVSVNLEESVRSRNILNEQAFALKLVTSKLRTAFNGMDVEWDDEEEDDEDAIMSSGSGSGDFSTVSSGEGRIREGIHKDPGPEDLEEGSGGDYDDSQPPPTSTHHHPHPPLPPSPQPPRELSTAAPPVLEQTPAPPTSSGSPSTPPRQAQKGDINVTRAVATYLFPIVVVWFQGMFSEW